MSGGTDSGKEEATAGIRGWKPKGRCAMGTRGANDRKPLGRSGRLSAQLKHSLLFLIPVLPSLKHSLYILNSEEGLDKKRLFHPGSECLSEQVICQSKDREGPGALEQLACSPAGPGHLPTESEAGHSPTITSSFATTKTSRAFLFPTLLNREAGVAYCSRFTSMKNTFLGSQSPLTHVVSDLLVRPCLLIHTTHSSIRYQALDTPPIHPGGAPGSRGSPAARRVVAMAPRTSWRALAEHRLM